MAQRDIEVLKGDGKQMGPVELPQSLRCRLARPSVPNALERGVDLHDFHLYVTTRRLTDRALSWGPKWRRDVRSSHGRYHRKD